MPYFFVTLPIFHHTDETYTLKNVGANYSIEDCQIRRIIFYEISAIGIYMENEKEYTSIFANGTEFICNKTVKETRELIHKAKDYAGN